MKIGLQLLAAALDSEAGIAAFRKVSTDHLRKSEQPVYDYILDHIAKFQVMPSKDTVEAKVGLVLPKPKEPVEYYVSEAQKRHSTSLLNKAIMAIHEPLAKHDPESAIKELLAVAGKFVLQRSEGQILNMLDAPDKLPSWYKSKILTGYSGIKSGWPYLDLRMGGLEPGDVLSIIGRPAQGKYQDMESNVLTTTGFKKMKDIRVGDQLASVDGAESRVLALHPQGEQELYEVFFEDGRSVEVGDDHLWEVTIGDSEPTVMFTKDIKALTESMDSSDGIFIPLFTGEYGWEEPLTDPYVFGVDLARNQQYGDLSIPEVCFDFCKSDRLALLQGIIDTLGVIDTTGIRDTAGFTLEVSITCTTPSKQFAVDLQRLVRSLGGVARTKYSSVGFKSDSFIWVLSIMLPKHMKSPRLLITRVRYSRKAECQCITVSHPRGLYVMDDYVVTHNTFLLLNMALHAWSKQNANVLLVTPEMKPTKIVERLSAMYTKTALTPLANAEMSPQGFDKLVVSQMEPIKGMKNDFWVVDGTYVPTIEDLYLLCTQLHPDAVYYDGAYLMKNKNPKLSKWDRLAETVLGLKDVASSLNIPTVASYQFSRAAVKKTKGAGSELPGLEDIYGSDEIGQTSSIVLGLLAAETVETIMRKKCTLLKGRGGERGSWDINWDFLTMNFDEVEEAPHEQKQLKFM